MKAAGLLLSLFLLLPFSFLYARDKHTEGSEDPNGNGANIQAISDKTVYIIQNIEFDINGRSKPYALMYHGELKEGEIIIGKVNFEKYLEEKTQNLVNQRLLEEVRIDHFIGEPDESGALPVNLLIYIKDSWNFIVLPYPKFDSNSGFSITLKARDYNFLGTMSPLRVDIGYQRNTDGKHTFNTYVDSDTHFRLFGLNWNFNFDNEFSYTIGNPLYYRNVTGLSVELPWRITTFTVGFNNYLTINQEVEDEAKDLYGVQEDFYDPFGTAVFYGYWSIPLGISAGKFGDIYYTPGISTSFNYPFSGQYEHRKPVTSLSHSIGFGRTDWIGNFRKGISASLSNSYSWFFGRSDAPLNIDINAAATVYWPFNKYIGVSTRFNYYQKWQWSDRNDKWLPFYSAGNRLRGVMDDDLQADVMMSLNIDFPIRLIRFWPSEWFNKPKLRLFNFEMFISPFLDLALLRGPYNDLKENAYDGTKFAFSDMVTAFGLEVIVYPAFFRSLRLRASVGYNINYNDSTCCVIHYIRDKPRFLKIFPKWNELYIGLDLFY